MKSLLERKDCKPHESQRFPLLPAGRLLVLREGWEKIMEPVMVKAILGARYTTADESLYHQVVGRVRDFIDKSTGIQTLVQMLGLVRMVRELGCVPEGEILDEFAWWLGHASVVMTLNVYSHALRGAQAELAETVASVIQRGSF
jgi:hypothetical protein